LRFFTYNAVATSVTRDHSTGIRLRLSARRFRLGSAVSRAAIAGAILQPLGWPC